MCFAIVHHNIPPTYYRESTYTDMKTGITICRVGLLFLLVWGVLWLLRPPFAYKYQPREAHEDYDYPALFVGAALITVIIGGIWWFVT